MRTNLKQHAIVFAVVTSLLAVSLLATWRYNANAAQKARYATEDLSESKRLVTLIESLQRSIDPAADETNGKVELAAMIETAADRAGVRPDQILQIDPQQPVSIPNTAFENARTRIDLRGVTLEQVIRTLHATLEGEPALTVERLALRPPTHAPDDRVWDADVVVARIALKSNPPTGTRR